MPVFIAVQSGNHGLNILESEAYEALPDSIVIDGLPEKQFFSMQYANQEGLPYEYGEEKGFIICDLHRSSGGETKFYDVDKERHHHQEIARFNSRDILQAYEAAKNSSQHYQTSYPAPAA